MTNNELNQKEILEKIRSTFQEALNIMNSYLENKIIEKLPIEMTTGNHEVYKICLQGNAETEPTEDGALFLFPGSGIIKHCHPIEKGITEIYKTIGPNKFHWQGKECDFNRCNLDEFHGIDIEDTPRAIKYIKTNVNLKNNTSTFTKKKTHK